LYDNISLIMSVLNLTSNCDAMKAKNHIVIFEGVVWFSWQNGWFLLKAKSWPDFMQAWHDFWIRLSYLGP